MNMKTVETEQCYLCGKNSSFIIAESATLFREARCIHCTASKRNSDVARTIIQTYRGYGSLSNVLYLLENLYIYEAQSSGPIHDILCELPHYFCSEYFDDTPLGSLKKGVRCEDVRNLTFPDNLFDLVITQDVFEHVQEPYQALNEIHRILIPNGFHIFTVPFHEGWPTIRRVIVDNQQHIYCKPTVYHGDPLREAGSLVYTDFGDDMLKMLHSMGMPTESITYSRWYEKDEITKIDSEEEYAEYIKFYEKKDFEHYFKYNSIVFRSNKNSS